MSRAGDAIRRVVGGWEDAAGRMLAADSPRAYVVAFVLLVVIVLAAAAALLATGCSDQGAMPWDGAYALDRAWRVWTGQRPHTDFFSILGPTSMLFTCLGFALGGASAGALGLSAAAVFPFIALGGWALARRRLSASLALAFALFAGFLLAGTYALGFPGTDFLRPSYAMQHNRLGWALVSLVTLWALAPPREALSRRRETIESAVAGAILALLLFLKLNIFAGALVIALAGLALGPKRWAATLAGFAVVSLAMLAFLRFDVASLAADLDQVRRVQTVGRRVHEFARLVRGNLFDLALFALALLAVLRPALTAPKGKGCQAPFACRPEGCSAQKVPDTFFFLAGALAVVAGGFILSAGNSQFAQLPMFPLAGLLLVEYAGRRRMADAADGGAPDRAIRHLFVALLTALLAAGILLPDMASVGVSFARKRLGARNFPQAAAVRCAPLEDLVCPPKPGEPVDEAAATQLLLRQGVEPSAYGWAVLMNDALALVRPHLRNAPSHGLGTSDRVVMLEWYNPMSFALGLPSPRGYPSMWAWAESVDERHVPPFDRAFGNVTLILVPKYAPPNPTSRWLRATYAADVERSFDKVAESALWELYRRNAAKAGASGAIGRPPAEGDAP